MEAKAILFDMDGVLLDSKEAWRQAFQEAGDVSEEKFEELFWGRDLTKNLEDIDMAGEEERFCKEIFSKYLDEIESIKSVKTILRQIDLPKALITNTASFCTYTILDRFGLMKYFKVIVTSDQVEKGKPASNMILKACEKLDCAPKECVTVGDSPEDIKAGRKAGCRTVGVGVEGGYTISHIRELPQVLQSMQQGT